jgi:hypothetical protein
MPVQLALYPDTIAGALDSGPPSSSTRRRTYLAAGVAIAGAGLIAVNPVAPTLPDIQARAVQLTGSAIDLGNAIGGTFDTLGADALNAGALSGVDGILDGELLNGLNLPDVSGIFSGLDLSSLPSPITAYLDLFDSTFTNLGAIGNDLLANPLPVLQQIITNQLGFANTIGAGLQSVGSALGSGLGELPGQVQTLFGDIASGNLTDAANVINNDILVNLLLLPGFQLLQSGVLNIPAEIAQNFANVFQAATSPLTLLGPLVGPLAALEGTITQAGDRGQAIVDAIGAGNPLAAFDALAAAPAQLADAFLNGTASSGAFGILSPGSLVDGLLAQLPQAIAQALGATGANAFTDLGPALAGALDSTVLADFGAAFDPAMVTDIASMLSADLVPNLVSGLLMDLPSMLIPF